MIHHPYPELKEKEVTRIRCQLGRFYHELVGYIMHTETDFYGIEKTPTEKLHDDIKILRVMGELRPEVGKFKIGYDYEKKGLVLHIIEKGSETGDLERIFAESTRDAA